MTQQPLSPLPTRADAVRLAALAGFAGILLSPVRHYAGPITRVNEAKNDQDSFPLSTFPMFSAHRKGRITVPHVVGFTAEGDRVLPHYRHYGGGGLNQVRRQLSRGIREGRAVDIAQTYADSLAHGPLTAEEERIVEVKLVRSRFLFDTFFSGDTLPQAESVHAACVVGGVAKQGRGGSLPRIDDKKPNRGAQVKETA